MQSWQPEKRKKRNTVCSGFSQRCSWCCCLQSLQGHAGIILAVTAEEVKDLKTQAIELVRHSSKETFKANQTSIVYASDESVISTLKGGKDSYYLSITDMPSNVECAIVSIEDKKFFRHNGIDYRALLRAVKGND